MLEAQRAIGFRRTVQRHRHWGVPTPLERPSGHAGRRQRPTRSGAVLGYGIGDNCISETFIRSRALVSTTSASFSARILWRGMTVGSSSGVNILQKQTDRSILERQQAAGIVSACARPIVYS